MLLNGHDVNGMDYDRRTALMVAANKSNASIITMLLDAGADADMKDSTGSTALLDACKAGSEAAIDILTRKTRLAKIGRGWQGWQPRIGMGWIGNRIGEGHVVGLCWEMEVFEGVAVKGLGCIYTQKPHSLMVADLMFALGLFPKGVNLSFFLSVSLCTACVQWRATSSSACSATRSTRATLSSSSG